MLLISLGRVASAGQIRVVSLAPNVTEILFALGLDAEEIVGITDYCDYPPATAMIARLGSRSTVNIEKIVSLRPDWVFAVGAESSPYNQKLKKAGLRVLMVNAESVEDMLAVIQTIGNVLGRSRRAAALIMRIRHDLAHLDRLAQAHRVKKRVYVELWDAPLTSAGSRSLVTEVIARAGGVNITASLKPLYPVIAQEFIIAANPDVILVGYMRGDLHYGREAICRRLGWSAISALKNNLIIDDLDPGLFLRPGPRITQGIKELHTRLYGENP